MEANLANASLAYAKALQFARDAKAGAAEAGEPGAATEPQFADLLHETIDKVAQATGQAEAASFKSMTGEVGLTDIVIAVNNAEITLQTVVAVRDRVIAAYQEIIRMPI